jgi:hypothetical protein
MGFSRTVALLVLCVVAVFGLAAATVQTTSSQGDSSAQQAGEIGEIDPESMTYMEAKWHPIHFKPAIENATDEQCLTCHQEILSRDVLDKSPAGARAEKSLAWYQTLDTYSGQQETLHRRHLTTPYAQKVMDLNCTFCHRGNDPREEAPGSSATAPKPGGDAGYTLRKHIDPSESCLRCHGQFGYEFMAGVTGPWPEVRSLFESEPTDNGCLVCHDVSFRTVRHEVTYLNAAAIEEAAKDSSDVCYGCHGGRAWFAKPFPYPRHPWPGMPEETPEWAKDRPTKSAPRYREEKPSKESRN